MTEKQIKTLGFQLEREYHHDQFLTRRYKLGVLEVEFTYEDGLCISHDLTISEINCVPINHEQLKRLSSIFGNTPVV